MRFAVEYGTMGFLGIEVHLRRLKALVSSRRRSSRFLELGILFLAGHAWVPGSVP